MPLTSVYGREASEQAQCGQLAVEEFNASGGLDGRRAELIVRDTKHNPDLARSMTIDLIDNDKVNFVVGALSAIDMVVLAKVCTERKIIYNGISVGDGIVSSENRSRYVFHEGPTAYATGDSISRYAFSHFGFKAATLTINAAFGPDTLRAIHHIGNSIGVEFVADEFHPMGEIGFRSQLEKILAAKPEVLVTTNFGEDQYNMLKAIHEMGLKKHMRVVCTSVSVPQRQRAGPEIYKDIVGGTGYYWAIEERIPSAKSFNQNYKKRFGEPLPSGHGIYGYCGVKSILAAVKSAHSVETDKVIEALEALRFDFCRGPQFYRRMDHQSVQPVIMLESKTAKEMKSDQDLFHVIDLVEFRGPRAFHINFETK